MSRRSNAEHRRRRDQRRFTAPAGLRLLTRWLSWYADAPPAPGSTTIRYEDVLRMQARMQEILLGVAGAPQPAGVIVAEAP